MSLKLKERKTMKRTSLQLLLLISTLILLGSALAHTPNNNFGRGYGAARKVTPRASRFFFGRNPYSSHRRHQTLYTNSRMSRDSQRAANIEFFDDDDEDDYGAADAHDDDDNDNEWNHNHASRKGKTNYNKIRNASQQTSPRPKSSTTTPGDFRIWNPSSVSRRNTLTQKLVWTNVAIFGLQAAFPSLTRMGAKQSDLILSGRELHRLVSPIFLHGGIVHLAMNSFSLNNIGPEVERCFGHGRFLVTYLAAGVAGNLVSAYMTPNPSVGASGAIFGLVGAYAVFLGRNKNLFGQSGERGLASLRQTFVTNLIYGFYSPQIDNWGHIGGALGGAAVAYAFGPKLYMAMAPTGQRFILDKPNLRLPSSFETFPKKLGERLYRLSEKMEGNYKSNMPAKPLIPNETKEEWQRRRNI